MISLQEATSVRRGETAPFCAGMTLDNTFYSSEGQAGRAALVILAGSLPPASLESLLQACRRRSADLGRLGADAVVLVDGQGDHVAAYGASREGPQIIYCLSEFFDRCCADQPSLFVVDRNQRVVAAIDGEEAEAAVGSALACIAALPAEEPRDIGLPAPLLLIPNILDSVLCGTLIDHFESSPHADGGMASTDPSGQAIHKVDFAKKRRQDCVLRPDEALYQQVLRALVRICLPEMKKAFQFEACRNDRILIARYDESGGYFKRHRDNVAAAVAYRQFALSINLNADYDGGHLAFPEYNDHRYRPGRGAGIIFSASLLHEAMPVTRGRRYVLLTFFHNAEAQARRAAGSAMALRP